MSELENPIQPTELVHTPKDMKELTDTLNRLNGEERIVKTPDGKLRLYRKELGAWYYLEFTRS